MTRNHLQGTADDQSRLDAIANLLEAQLECSLRTDQEIQRIIETSERISSEIAEIGSNLDQHLREIQEDFSSAAKQVALLNDKLTTGVKQLASLNIALIKDETRRPHEETSSMGTIAGDNPSSCQPEHAETDYAKTRALDNTNRFDDFDPDDPPYNPWDSFIEHFKSIQREEVYRQNARNFGGWDAFVFRVTRGYEP
jgi:cell division protein ZapA (FtsZ GTPase activity inhibitor)